MTDLGKNINAARMKQKLSQDALALRMGYTGRNPGVAISHFERGAREPRFGTLQRIADALGIPVTQLAGKTREGYANRQLKQGRPRKA